MEKKNVNIKNENKNHFVFEQGWLKYKEVRMGGGLKYYLFEKFRTYLLTRPKVSRCGRRKDSQDSLD